MKNKIIVLCLSLSLLSSCAPDPRKQAQADAIRIAAEQDAADRAQARAQDERVNALTLEAQAISIENKSATAEQWRASLSTFIKFGFAFFTAAVCLALISTSVGYSWAVVGRGRGIALAAQTNEELRANLIPLDSRTRQFPLLRHVHGTRWMLINPNAGQALALDERNDPDRQMISAMGAVQYIGVLAPEARQSADPAGMAMMQTPIVEVKA